MDTLPVRQNFFRAISEFGGLWECFQGLNNIWHREIGDLEHLREVKQMLPCLIFRYAHSRFLIAMELGFSCCFGDVYSVLRGGIEAVAQAHKIHREPQLATVWSEKSKGKIEEIRYKEAFEAKKETSLFPAAHGLGQLYAYWKQFSTDIVRSSCKLQIAAGEKSVSFRGMPMFSSGQRTTKAPVISEENVGPCSESVVLCDLATGPPGQRYGK